MDGTETEHCYEDSLCPECKGKRARIDPVIDIDPEDMDLPKVWYEVLAHAA